MISFKGRRYRLTRKSELFTQVAFDKKRSRDNEKNHPGGHFEVTARGVFSVIGDTMTAFGLGSQNYQFLQPFVHG